MNHTTKEQREKWIARAAQIIKLDRETTALTNGPYVIGVLVGEFGISYNSARTATAKASRRARSAKRR